MFNLMNIHISDPNNFLALLSVYREGLTKKGDEFTPRSRFRCQRIKERREVKSRSLSLKTLLLFLGELPKDWVKIRRRDIMSETKVHLDRCT